MTGAELLDAVVSCDACAEAAPALCDAHEALATELERRAEPPTVTPIGNLHDLLAAAGCGGDK